MDNTLEKVGIFFITLTAIIIGAFFGGTIVWACWDVIPTTFPSAVESGIIAEELEWWSAVKLSFLASTLLKATTINTKS